MDQYGLERESLAGSGQVAHLDSALVLGRLVADQVEDLDAVESAAERAGVVVIGLPDLDTEGSFLGELLGLASDEDDILRVDEIEQLGQTAREHEHQSIRTENRQPKDDAETYVAPPRPPEAGKMAMDMMTTGLRASSRGQDEAGLDGEDG
jgi:hypothetical protein